MTTTHGYVLWLCHEQIGVASLDGSIIACMYLSYLDESKHAGNMF